MELSTKTLEKIAYESDDPAIIDAVFGAIDNAQGNYDSEKAKDALRKLSALRPLARDSGVTPASRPDSAPGEAESVPRHVPRPRALLPRGRARVKVSALSARSAAFWR